MQHHKTELFKVPQYKIEKITTFTLVKLFFFGNLV